ncbi:anthranilate synthase component I [Ramicandelaber brevisporus]|nr:anthranilate synthase component I [Ramicandelaber brevisporus]
MTISVEPSLAKVKELLASSNGNIIPVYAEIPADLLTPVSAYLKIANSGGSSAMSFLLESVAGGEKIGRYSFIGARPYKILTKASTSDDPTDGVRLTDAQAAAGDPLNMLEQELKGLRFINVPGLPEFTGGAIGYIGYDCIKYFEPTTTERRLKDPLKLPESVFMMCESIIIFDNVRHVIKIVDHIRVDDALTGGSARAAHIEARYAEAVKLIQSTVTLLMSSNDIPLPHQPPVHLGYEFESNISKEEHAEMVKKTVKHIEKGDIFQAVVGRRVSRRTDLHPFNAYRYLRTVNPAPYMFYVDLGDFQLVGASPEVLSSVRVDRTCTVRPIAGTCRRGKDDAEDAASAARLLADEKERAEHVMLVDLGRNDLNRVCQPDSVTVKSLMHIEKYSHVIHIVSDLEGKLRDDKTPFDMFRSAFPAGTLSGAPKVRAMQLISEFEGMKRGVYGGAVGHFDFSGGFDTCIAIRTMVFKDGVAYLQAGGGIVYDSKPENEWEETVQKLGSNMTALQRAEELHYALQQQQQQQQQ